MTENGDPYENALAERMNRTLKEEFGLGRPLLSKQQAFRLTEEAILLYNQNRPHLSLKMQTPNAVHLQKTDHQRQSVLFKNLSTYFRTLHKPDYLMRL
jgi:transposase InsO family protein